MYSERTFHQRRQSSWSIWWFVALMAAGLTAWHLELLPWHLGHVHHPMASSELHEDLLEQMSDEPKPEMTSLPNERSLEAISQVTTPDQIPLELGPPSQPGQEPAFDSIPVQPAEELASVQEIQSSDKRFTSGDIWAQAPEATEEELEDGYWVPEIHPEERANATFAQVGYTEPAESNTAETQTLLYSETERPATNMVLPYRGSEPPIQYASQSEKQSSTPVPVMTAALEETTAIPVEYEIQPVNHTQNNEPQQLTVVNQISDKAEQDVLRLRELSGRYWQQKDQRASFEAELLQLSHKVYFQQNEHYIPAHTVQPNQNLSSIAEEYDITWQYLANLNRITPEKLRAGEAIKVIQGPFDAIVELSNYRLTVHAHGYVVAIFPIGIGKDASTPLGQFAVLNKLENPTYYGPDKVISCDDPQNPLGEYWIDLGNSIGIHGTNEPESIGRSESHGCVRMRNEDAEAVYQLLTSKSRVAIRQ